MNKWYVYILRCRDQRLYAGVTIDVERRLDEHNHNDRLAAKYTRSRRPVKLIFTRCFDTRSQACQFETRVKRMTKQQKEKLVLQQQGRIYALS